MEQTDRMDCRGTGSEKGASWERGVRRVVPYTPGEQPRRAGIIKLNTNECPYPPSPQVKRLAAEFETDVLRLYPDPEASLLVKSIAAHFGVGEDQVFVGVGSDDVLAMAFLTFFNTDKPILFPDITYSFYDVWANLFGIPFRRPALDENFRLVKEDYLVPNGGIVIANPNAPTGICEPLSVIEEIVRKNPASLVIIDEAYVDFGGESAMPLVEKYENLLVVHTFSKSRAMAGMRMPEKYVAEMICDRIAASKNYMGDKYTDASAWEYYDRSKDHYILHPDTRAQLETALTILKDQGEDACFRYIRTVLLGRRD